MPKILKVCKTKPLWPSFYVAKWALEDWECGRNLGQIPAPWICAKQLWFLFPKLFVYDVFLGKLFFFSFLGQKHIVVREKDVFPKFCNGADLKFQIQYRAECYLPWSNGHHTPWSQKATTKKLLRIWFHKTFWAELASPSDHHSGTATGSRQVKERPELFWSSFSIP